MIHFRFPAQTLKARRETAKPVSKILKLFGAASFSQLTVLSVTKKGPTISLWVT
jgi:hypothetical protein